ncbi:MAG: hypothetical protein AAB922_05675 [Patescibacteria group bacterium]
MNKEYTIGWEQKCKGCGHHDSMWKSLVTSPQWKKWYVYQTGENQQYDVDECRELGVMSAEHFQDFMKFSNK